MATATLCTTVDVTDRASPAPPPHLSLNTCSTVPNKHLPNFPPISTPTSTRRLSTPPASPPNPSGLIETTSLTHPPSDYDSLSDNPPVYLIDAAQLAKALEHIESQPLPSTKQVFPWLHGLHADNQLQLAFFTARRRSLRRTPKCIRGLTIVKAGGDLLHSKLKGAIAPDEILRPWQIAKDKTGEDCDFLDIDPRDGFSVRNFQIQACKMATVSDIVVYGDENA